MSQTNSPKRGTQEMTHSTSQPNASGLFGKVLSKLREDPRGLLSIGIALARGLWVSLYYRTTNRRVRINLPFYVYGKVRICGPGSVRIGKGCSARVNSFDCLTIATYTSDSQVVIGERCTLGGITIRCKNRVTIENRVMTAVCLVQDFLLAGQDPRQSTLDQSPPSTTPDILIQENVWLGSQALVLAGSRIGNNSVVGTGSMCFRQDVAADRVSLGNPALRSLGIRAIAALLEKR